MQPFRLLFLSLLILFMLKPTTARSEEHSNGGHPYYVSIYQINYSEDNQALQITAKIFTEDLEKGLIEAGYPTTKLGTKEELDKTDQYIEQWLRDRFIIHLDEEEKSWSYLGKEAEINATWLYLEITDIDKPSQITVRNTALLDVYDTQTNMTHVDLGGEVKTLLLRNSEAEGTLTFP